MKESTPCSEDLYAVLSWGKSHQAVSSESFPTSKSGRQVCLFKLLRKAEVALPLPVVAKYSTKEHIDKNALTHSLPKCHWQIEYNKIHAALLVMSSMMPKALLVCCS